MVSWHIKVHRNSSSLLLQHQRRKKGDTITIAGFPGGAGHDHIVLGFMNPCVPSFRSIDL